ncbi:Annexin A5 [Acipenser ruthenus]|uniref:Annexin A5 n=1 Tax=Acipenser ruthenus TaxID=7906 RepID=A0A444U7K3_ACIRT|nr:Annexin A5 [Acipenser ruthenus]
MIRAGTDENVLIEILAYRTASQVKEIIATYKQEYDADLEEAVIGDIGGHFQRMLVVLLQDIFAAGEQKWGTDEEKFITILGNRNAAHLRVFDEYMEISGYEIEESIERETSGNTKNLFLAVKLLEVNKRWDEYFKIMKQRYEQKEEKERIYNTLQEVKRQNRGLKEQNASLTRKKEHQECEIGRLNKALSEALKASIRNAGREEMVTQIEVLQQQVQIYEEDFKKERCDRERLNEKYEELQSELNVLKSQAKEFSQPAASPHFPPPRCCSQWVASPHRAKVYGLSPHYTDTRSPRIHQDRQEDQQHSLNYQWFVSSADHLPPDVQHIPPNHTANVFSVGVCTFPMAANYSPFLNHNFYRLVVTGIGDNIVVGIETPL